MRRLKFIADGYTGYITDSQDGDLMLYEDAKPFIDACREFMRKVENGEARSTRSYAQMKKAFKNLEKE